MTDLTKLCVLSYLPTYKILYIKVVVSGGGGGAIYVYPSYADPFFLIFQVSVKI